MTRDSTVLLEKVNQVLAGGAIPHNTALGIRAVACGRGSITMELPYRADLVGNPETGVLHGGAITALLDATCGMSIFLATDAPTRIATIDLRIDYMTPATPDRAVLAWAECYKLTRHVAFTRAVAYHDSKDEPIAAAAGTFMRFHDEPSITKHGMEQR